MSSLRRCGPYEPGTCTLVAVEDGTEFSYQRAHAPQARLPNPGERVRMRWTTSDSETPCGEGIVVGVLKEKPAGSNPRFGHTVLVLWSVEPDRMFNPTDDDDELADDLQFVWP